MPKWLSLQALLICLALGSGCGGDAKDPLNDPNTFSGRFRDKLEFNCTELMNCNAVNKIMGGPGWYDDCLNDSASRLNGDPAAQQSFVAAFTRCSIASDYCAYVTCAGSSSPYGASHADKFTYQCQQELMCKQMGGMSIGDPNEALAQCVGFNIGTFDNLSPAQRAAYDEAFPTCSALGACDFVGCFEN